MESVGTKMGALAPYISRRRHSRWGKWVRAMAHITLRSVCTDGNVGRILAEVGLNGGSHEVAAAGDADAELLGLGVGAEEVGVRLFVGETEGEGGNEA